jgi:hypothetical protein
LQAKRLDCRSIHFSFEITAVFQDFMILHALSFGQIFLKERVYCKGASSILGESTQRTTKAS